MSGNITEKEVRDYLMAHPEFLRENTDVLELLHAPDQRDGTVLDFQSFTISSLQSSLHEVRKQLDELVVVARGNHSMQMQVQRGVSALIAARTLERFLDVLCSDIPAIFNLDVVRLALESDMPNPYESYYPEACYSGMVLIAEGAASHIFQGRGKAWLVADNVLEAPDMADAMFMECTELARSSAYLHMRLNHVGRDAILALGVRERERFNENDSSELLEFLAHITALKLDQLLYEQAGLL